MVKNESHSVSVICCVNKLIAVDYHESSTHIIVVMPAINCTEH